MRITQSLLGDADKCLLSLQYKLDRPEWAKRVGSASRALGTAYHAGLESYYLQRKDAPGLLPDGIDMYVRAQESFEQSMFHDSYDDAPLDEFKWDDRVPDLDVAMNLLSALLNCYVDERHFWPHEYTVIDVEASYTVTVGDVEAKLGADLVLVDPNGWITLVDHKTAGKAWDQGKHMPRKNNQASLYTELARQMWPDAPGHQFVFDIITYPTARSGPKFERRVSRPDLGHGAAIVKKASDVLALYETVHVQMGRDLPANPASTLCNPKWCDWFEGCPFGAALDH